LGGCVRLGGRVVAGDGEGRALAHSLINYFHSLSALAWGGRVVAGDGGAVHGGLGPRRRCRVGGAGGRGHAPHRAVGVGGAEQARRAWEEE
jgi:hypothetical protein